MTYALTISISKIINTSIHRIHKETVVEEVMKQNKTKIVVLHALFIAIEMLLVLVPFLGYIPIGPLRAVTLHIPVIIAGIVLGKKSGAIVGLTFGLCSLFYNTINPTVVSFAFSPFISGNIVSAVIAIVPRVMIGYMAGLVFEHLKGTNINTIVSMAISAIVGAFTNTILVLGGIYILFGNSYALALGKSFQELLPYFLGILTTQSILEAIVGAFIAVIVSKPLLKITK
jgi:uncharacterized membrane protein